MKQNNGLIAKEYNLHAAEYDEMSRKATPWLFFDKPYLQKSISPLLTSKMKLLDVGCGAGKALEVLCKQGLSQRHIVGVDVSEELLALAKSHLPDARFVLGSMTKLEVDASYFDAALSVRALEYLTVKQLAVVFKQVFASLKSGGRFFVITGHPLRVNDGDMARYLERGPRRVSLPWGMKVDLQHKTISDFLMAAISAGFGLESIDEPEMPPIIKRKYPEQYQKYKSFGATNLHLVFRKG